MFGCPAINCCSFEISLLEALDKARSGAAAAPRMRAASEATTEATGEVVVVAAGGDVTNGFLSSSTASIGISLIGGNLAGTSNLEGGAAGKIIVVIGEMLAAALSLGALFKGFSCFVWACLEELLWWWSSNNRLQRTLASTGGPCSAAPTSAAEKREHIFGGAPGWSL